MRESKEANEMKLTKENDTNGSIQRAFAILEALFNSNDHLSVFAIAEKCQIPKTTAFRILNTLYECKCVDRDQDNNYSLGLLFTLYGEKVKSDTSLVSISTPLLTALRDKVQETVNLAILFDKKYIVNIVTLQGEAFILTSRTLPIAPLHCSSSGKLFLSDMSLTDIKAYFSVEYPQHTLYTITTYEGFLSERETIIKEKMAFDNEEYEYGLQCMAAPIFDNAGCVAATVSVTGPLTRLKSKGIDYIKDQVQKTAEQITRIIMLARLNEPFILSDVR